MLPCSSNTNSINEYCLICAWWIVRLHVTLSHCHQVVRRSVLNVGHSGTSTDGQASRTVAVGGRIHVRTIEVNFWRTWTTAS